mmetsp:Transcript_56407/g.148341  ORF Transcript_56407/g.148341 Transcript_56407/m.148341 type:complete len:240 (+) Transcript_56407:509-1228(+)
MYFWQIHWKPSLAVVLKISSSSRITWMPRPRDFIEGFTIQALRIPLIWCCGLFASSSTSSSRACCMNFRPRGVSHSATGQLRGVGSSGSFLLFLLLFAFAFALSRSLTSFTTSFSFFHFSLGLGNFLLIISSSSSSLMVTSSRSDGLSRQTRWRTSHSAGVTVLRVSASSAQSRISSTSVTRRVQIFKAMPTTSMPRTTSAPASMLRRNSRRTDSALENLKCSTKSARSQLSERSKAWG